MNSDIPFLKPIEKPKGALMRIIYLYSKWKFGKILTPVKVSTARLPFAFALFMSKPYELDKKLTLPEDLIILIRHLVACLNICNFCIDIGRYQAMKKMKNIYKMENIENFQADPMFTIEERSALTYAKEITLYKRVNQSTFDNLAHYYNDREICEISYVVSTEHLVNISNISLNIHSDMLCKVKNMAVLN